MSAYIKPAHLDQFLLSDDMIYLNHAAVSPWPICTADAIKSFTDENLLHGARYYPDWLKTEDQLKQNLAKLINAAANDIAILKNTSEALSIVACGLPWQAGDNVVITNQEFPSNRIVWESLKPLGVNVIEADIADYHDAENNIINLINDKTRIVSVSAVQFANGFHLDLQKIGKACKDKQVLFCIDAIQSIGVTPFDVQAIHADFAMADGHKWMMSPEGSALFYCHHSVRDTLKLNQFGWHMVEHAHDFDRHDWQPADSARRFECGSPNMLGIHAMNASIKLILDIGVDNIYQQILENSMAMIEYIKNSNNLALISADAIERLSGIITFKHNTTDNNKLYQYLMDKGVICSHRGGGIRYSPHFYTPKEKIIMALEIADKFSD